MTIPATAVQSFVVTIPAGTLQSAPYVQDCSFPDASVVSIRWRVPPGPSGYMGFAVTSDGAFVIPVNQGTFIVADDETANWPIAGYQDSGSWQVTGYNTDSYDHSVYLDFLTVAPGADQSPPATSAANVPVVTNSVISPPPPSPTTFTAGVEVPT